ncbi:hypothetical protein QO021_30310 (plasmid) [Pseudomonas amygdali pv. lachrymans]|uniref:hypothetical protein n=1 Tax=Pseudomonas amygdali TaxID=47877 RepID=UPI0006B9F702|nr:hypothetical protein [Pseudomonas amygdali]RMM39394.1 hypothetical protein ALQ79_200761 [Pseudomonas amygdali pv. lachrymans]WIO61382.1 hypothetical protein QO021_30310 [Pseudomonas amygdali pv. lachrymans]
MKVSEEIANQICNAIPDITPTVLDSIFASAGTDSQLLFVQGEGGQVIDGKSKYPDYLQVQICNAQDAMALAQQLVNACSAAMGNGGVLRSPITLLIAGQAIVCE